MVNDVIIEEVQSNAMVEPFKNDAHVSLAPIETITVYYDVVSHGVINNSRRTDLVGD